MGADVGCKGVSPAVAVGWVLGEQNGSWLGVQWCRHSGKERDSSS